MATPLQTLKAQGFKELGRKHQTSSKYVYYGIIESGKVVAKAGIETHWSERNPSSVVVFVAGKRREIHADYNDKTYTNKRFNEAQIQKLEALILEAKQAGPAPEKPAKPRPVSPMKGKTLTDDQKAENRVWRHLGYLTCVGFVDKEMRERLYYVKAGKYIRVEDLDSIMAYANIRDKDLEAIGMTVSSLEQFLVSKGIEKKRQKRVKRQFPLYD